MHRASSTCQITLAKSLESARALSRPRLCGTHMPSHTSTPRKRDASAGFDQPDAPPSKSAKITDTTNAATPLPSDDGQQTVADASNLSRTDAIDHQLPRSSQTGNANATPNPFAGNSPAIKEHIGDLFEAPDNSVIVHACNAVGSWGGGIAAAFRQRYPQAYQIYKKHCTKEHNFETDPVPRGTCLLIPPVESKPGAPKHWIGCLFTSAKYGRAKDPPHVILRHTGPAFRDLLAQLDSEPTIQEVRMCQINAGLFAVPWSDTKEALQDVLATTKTRKDVHVYSPASLPTSSRSVGRKSTSKGKFAGKGQGTLNSFVTKK